MAAPDPDPRREVAATDPVIARRRRIAGWVDVGQKVGYGLFGLAVVAFLVGFVVGLEPWVVTLIVACLVVGVFAMITALIRLAARSHSTRLAAR